MARFEHLSAVTRPLVLPALLALALPASVLAEEVVQELPTDYIPVEERELLPLLQEPQVMELGTGEASWYGKRFAGRPTANGETFDPGELTAAHRELPFGSLVRVTHLRNGKSVIVRINDRGPFHKRRVIDLSRAAAEQLGMTHSGRAQVRLELLHE
jgi:rare lipoprotein A